MTDSKTTPASESTPTPAATVVATPTAQKTKRPCTPKQLEQLKAAREKRKRKSSASGQSDRVTRSDNAEEFVKRIEKVDSETTYNSSKDSSKERSPKRRKTTGFGRPRDFAIGALVLGGLSVVAYQAKKKVGNSSSAKPPQDPPQPQPQPQTNSSTPFHASNVFA